VIYPVSEDTLLVKSNVPEAPEKVLEIGSGNGEIASSIDGEVTVTDIDPEALEHLEERFDNVIESDLFENVDSKFDLIIFNPPYLSGPKGVGAENTWRGGETGLEVSERYLSEVDGYLREDGSAFVVLSSRTNYQKLVDRFELERIDSKKLFFEEIFLFEYRPQQ